MVGILIASIENTLVMSSMCSLLLVFESVARSHIFSLFGIGNCCLFGLASDSLVLVYSIVFDAQAMSVLAYKKKTAD